MRAVVLKDQGDYWEVIMDYSGSPRHASLTEEQWKEEYATDPSYETMRKDQVGFVAAFAPKGGGKWKKDWSGPYVEEVV